ncbi:MAG: O-antigen ligase family protein [Candidatus Aureabacteria bacterium]|nr:O-antigen ligase family protein [Candidatus Auribacterota bacterium]
MDLKKISLFLLTLALPFCLGVLFLQGSQLLTQYSSHVYLVSFMAIAGLILFGIGLILKSREYFFFLYMGYFPFYSIYQARLNATIAFAVLFIFIYRSKLLDFFKNKKSHFHRPFYLLVLSLFISLLNSQYRLEAFAQAIQYLSYIIVLLSFFTEIDSFKKLKTAYHILMAMVILGGMMSVIQIFFGIETNRIFTYNLGFNTISKSGFLRYPSIFIDAQTAALFFSVTGILLGGYFSVVQKNFKWNFFFMAWGTFFLLLTGTRIAYAGFLLSLFIFTFNKTQKVVSLIVLALVFALFAIWSIGISFPFMSSIDTDRFTIYNLLKSVETRLEFWGNGLITFLNNPLGSGLGASNLYAAAVKSNLTGHGIGYLQENIAQFESAFFDISCSLGYIGLVGILWLLGYFFYLGRLLYKKRDEIPLLEFSRYLMGAMSCFIICCLTAPVNRQDSVKFLFIFLLGSMFYLYITYLSKQIKRIPFQRPKCNYEQAVR